jgi:hypothetical protein
MVGGALVLCEGEEEVVGAEEGVAASTTAAASTIVKETATTSGSGSRRSDPTPRRPGARGGMRRWQGLTVEPRTSMLKVCVL